MKKIIIVCMIAVIACLGFAGCGEKEAEEPEEPAYVTYAQYMEIYKSFEYASMDKAALDEYYGVEGVIDEELTKKNVENLGEGWSTCRYYGQSEDAFIMVLFKTDENGKQKVASMNASDELKADGTYVEEETEE